MQRKDSFAKLYIKLYSYSEDIAIILKMCCENVYPVETSSVFSSLGKSTRKINFLCSYCFSFFTNISHSFSIHKHRYST